MDLMLLVHTVKWVVMQRSNKKREKVTHIHLNKNIITKKFYSMRILFFTVSCKGVDTILGITFHVTR